MKITKITPYIIGDVRNFLFVEVETDEGITGIGEAGITWKEKSEAGYVEQLAYSLVGEDPMRIEHLWQLMLRVGFFPANRIGAAAISAIDIALWDIKGKALGVPVYELLGGRVRDKVVAYPHVVGDTPEELAADAKQKVAEGWRFARFNLPDDGDILDPRKAVRDGYDAIAAVREAVGDDVELIMDVHTRLDPTEAVTLCRDVEHLKPYFIEAPIRSEFPGALKRLRQLTGTPIAIGEQWATKWEFRETIEQDLTDFARIDLCIVGGITEARKVAGWCETHYIPIAPHNPLGPVSTAACLHLDMATSNFAVQECARPPGTVLPELFPEQVQLVDGHLYTNDAPGLGITFNRDAVSAYPPVEGECPRLSRPDGTFTNW